MKKIIEKILNTNIIEEINLENKQRTFYSKDILENEILQVKNKKVQIILSEEISPDISSKALNMIFSNKGYYEIIQDLTDTDDELYLLFLAKSKYPKFFGIKSLKKRLVLKNKELFGIILLN